MSTTEASNTLYTSAQLDAVIADMAAQALRVLRTDLPIVLVGVLRRGEPLAQRLAAALQPRLGGAPLPVHGLKLKRYADDLQLLHPGTALTENPTLEQLDLANSQIVLVDDVLYGGHSLLRAVAYLSHCGARCIRTAVLVDRCVATLPVRADICGLRLQVAPTDIIECHVPPYEAEFLIQRKTRPMVG